MSRQDLFLVDPVIGEKTVCCFGVGPVLTGPGDAATDVLRQLFQKLAEPLAVARILKFASLQLAVDPTVGLQSCKSLPLLLHGSSSPLYVPSQKCLA
jgi:hypothetical protein